MLSIRSIGNALNYFAYFAFCFSCPSPATLHPLIFPPFSFPLPLYPSISDADVEKVVAVVKNLAKQS
jgi:hypothetical protein